jgi:hypothetical protein
MRRLGRGSRRTAEWSSPHERARTRAAQRLDWPLDPDEAAWLDAHLTDCLSCSALAADYVDIRNRLRALRSVTPPPPRDLWARTAAAIEQEARHQHGSRRAPAGRVPLGALSGVLVIAVVLGATLLSNPPRPGITTPDQSAVTALGSQDVQPTAGSTPIIVGAGDVHVIYSDRDGTYGYSRLGVDQVCPDGAAECPTARDPNATSVAFQAEPETIIGSPDDDRAVVVGTADGTKANNVIVMSLPNDDAASTAPSSEPIASPTPVETASAEPSPTDVASPGASPAIQSPTPAETPPASDDPSVEPSLEPSFEPSGQPATPTPSVEISADPSPTPEAIAIASDLIVVGQTAAFSPDGRWFAFTGRPADETTGPDIYVWHVGDERARAVTTDHRSVFASWADGRLVGSRASADVADGVEVAPEAFLLDPETGTEAVLADTGWRPIVAPDGQRALVFNGSVAGADDGRLIEPGNGSIELRTWDESTGAAEADATVVLDASASQFDARWDESGTVFAVWIEDPVDPSFGRLSLYFVDPETGALEQPDNAPRDEPALPGFSLGHDRLAWATPAGQGGEGSRVLIVAWTDDGVGAIETAPGERALVVR